MARPRKPPPPAVARRRRGTGSVQYVARLGSWRAVPPRSLDRDRKPAYGFATAEAAAAYLDALLAPAPPAATRAHAATGDYLLRWYAEHEPGWPRSTARKRFACLKHLAPLRDVPLAELRAEPIRAVVAGLQRAGLAPRTVRDIVTTLRQALRQAVGDGLIPSNPTDGVRLPRQPRTEPPHWSPDEVDAFLAAARGHRFELLFRLALTLGLRNGEVRALRREDVDLAGGWLHVRRSSSDDRRALLDAPKNRRERRIRLPSVLAEAIRAHLAAQNPASPWLWPSGDWPVSAQHLRRTFRQVRLEANAARRRAHLPELPALTFHSCRHTAATYLLALGIEPQEVARQLGHHSAAFTYDRYARVSERMAETAAATLDAALRARFSAEN